MTYSRKKRILFLFKDWRPAVNNVLQKVGVTVRTLQECKRFYEETGVSLNEAQMCAGGEIGKSSCNGDSGGPLQMVNLPRQKIK